MERQTSDASIREFLSLPSNDLEARSNYIPEFRKLIQDRSGELAASISEATGKAIKWSRAEIKASLDILTKFEHVPDLAFEEAPSPGFARMTISMPSNGASIIFTDTSLPVYSLISKLLPSILTRKSSIVFPDNRSRKTINILAEMLGSSALKNAVYFAFRNERELTSPVLHYPFPVDILSSGTVDMARLTGKHLTSMFSAEFGSGYSIHLLPGSDLDVCAEEVVQAMVSLHLPHHFRPGEITLFAEDEEYFRNRLVTEFEKLKVGDPFSEETDVGIPFDVDESISVAKLILSGRGKKYDVPFWTGPLAEAFGPCLITGIVGDVAPDIQTADLPVLRVRTVNSSEEALELWKQSGNLITGSIWSRDESVLPYIIKRTEFSVVYLNSLLKNVPGVYSNPSAGSTTTGNAISLFRTMATRRTGYLSL